MSERKVAIKYCVIAMFDKTLSKSFFNEIDLDINSISYIEKIIQKAINEMDYKEGIIKEDNEINIMKQDIIDNLYQRFLKRLDNKSSCLILCEYLYDKRKYVGCFRMEYQQGGYTYLSVDGILSLYFNEKILPPPTRRLKEFFIYCYEDNKIRVFGDKDYQSYFSESFKVCRLKTESEIIDALDEAVKETICESYDKGLGTKKILEYKGALVQEIEETGEVKAENILDTVFSDSLKAQKIYAEQLKEKEIDNEGIAVSSQMEKKIRKKQKIKTSNGIEIIIPVDMLNEINSIEYIQDKNGKISIVIKDVGDII